MENTVAPWDHLRTWFDAFNRIGLLKLAELERRAGVPAQTLDKWYHKRLHRGEPRVPADKHLPGIYRELAPLGYRPPTNELQPNDPITL